MNTHDMVIESASTHFHEFAFDSIVILGQYVSAVQQKMQTGAIQKILLFH